MQSPLYSINKSIRPDAEQAPATCTKVNCKPIALWYKPRDAHAPLLEPPFESFLPSFFILLSFSSPAESLLFKDDLLLDLCSPFNRPLMPLGALSAPSLKWCPPFGVAVTSPIPSTCRYEEQLVCGLRPHVFHEKHGRPSLPETNDASGPQSKCMFDAPIQT